MQRLSRRGRRRSAHTSLRAASASPLPRVHLLDRLEFTTDAFDRKTISWAAIAHAGISGSDVRNMMLETGKMLRRQASPRSIEHLFGKRSAYTARKMKVSAQALNLVPSFTPVGSPQSNGMSAAFALNAIHLPFPTPTSAPEHRWMGRR